MILLADRIEGGIEGQQTLGGLDVVVRRNAFGRQVDSFEVDVDFEPFEHPFHALFIRAPWVEKVGDGVEVLATVAGGPAAGRIVAVRQGAIMATSFHPEITADDRVHRYFVDLVRHLPARDERGPSDTS
jgi:5'-phosphate synthase pdxT subunit